MNRRNFLKLGLVGASSLAVPFSKELIASPAAEEITAPAGYLLCEGGSYANAASAVAILKEIYADSLTDLIYYDNPTLKNV